MKNGKKQPILSGYHKLKLFEYISRLELPFHEKIIYDQTFFKLNYNLEILHDWKLQMYINFLYEKYNNYEKLNYLDKVYLIKNAKIRDIFIKEKSELYNNINNALAIDLVLLKEIQLEKERNKNKSKNKIKSNHKTKSFDPTKTAKIPNKNKNIFNDYKNETFYKTKKEDDIFKYSIDINKAIKIIEKLNNKIIIWIDEYYDNPENIFYFKILKSNKNLLIYRFNNVNDAFEFILFKNEFNFKEIFILVSGSLYPNYYQEIKTKINNINFLPICCVFTSFNKAKEIDLNTTKFKEINSPFYNKEGVKTEFIDCIQSFEKYILFYNSNLSKKYNTNILSSYEGCFTFEQIFSKKQLAFPFLFNEIMEQGINTIPQSDITNFINLIKNKYNEEKIQKYIIPMIYIEKIPIEILSKYFVRMYTEESSFYYSLNQSLMRKENTYDIFVKIIYKGLSLGSLHYSEEDILYRGAKMSKSEIENIKKSFEEWKKNKNNKLPKYLLYSRTFLSFTKEKAKIKYFLEDVNENCYRVVFYLKNNKDIAKKYSSNADIENLSVNKKEKEVLFFPYTTFYLKNIYEGEYNNEHCFYFELDYFGQYEYIFEELKKNENFRKDVFNSDNLDIFSYGCEVINKELLPLKDDNNNENDSEYKSKDKNYLPKFLEEIKILEKELINVIFKNSDGKRFLIKCSPNTTISEMISYFIQSFKGKNQLTIDELKRQLVFRFNASPINNFSSMKLKEYGKVEVFRITVFDNNNVLMDL